MIQNMATTTIPEVPSSGEATCGGYAFTQPRSQRRVSRKMNPLCALVTSSDEAVQQSLAETIVQCGLIAFRAFTVGESKRIVSRREIRLVVCDDRLIDGKFEDLVKTTEASWTKAPVIVVSRAGDWPDYFKAMTAGVFDFLAYPPIPGELSRVVHYALQSPALQRFEEAETKHSEFWGGRGL